MSARVFIPLALGFSRVFSPAARANRFNGLPGRPAETVETVPASIPAAHTWLKPGAKESFFGTWNLGFGASSPNPHPTEVT